MRPDIQIIDTLKELWNTEDFIFDAEYSTETDRPNKYFGKICNIRNSNGEILIHPGFDTPLFFNLWKQLNIEPGHCRIKISLQERDYREKSGWEYEFKFRLLLNRTENISIIPELKRRWKLRDEYFIGSIHIEEKTNRYYVNDIRRSDFSKITAKIEINGEQTPLTIKGDATYLELPKNNRYYKFSWRLHKSSTLDAPKFWIDTQKPVVLFEPKQIVQCIHDDIIAYPGSASQIIVKTLDTLKNQLTASGKEVFIYELLQNANDYPTLDKDKKPVPVDVEFTLTDNYLLFQHSGSYFNPRNIAAICNINDKEKTDNREAIGYKGIGFKTVFLDNNYVFLKTGDYTFRFDEKESKDILDTPWQILPIWTDIELVDSEIQDNFSQNDSKYCVQFALRPIKHETLYEAQNNYAQLFQKVFETERVLLFIPNIRRVIVSGEKYGWKFIRNKSNLKWCVSDPLIADISEDLRDSINQEIKEGNTKIPEKYKDFNKTTIKFACALEGRTLKPVDDTCLYCYLPAKKARLGFPFLMNTDMIPTGARDDIEDMEVNHEIAHIAGNKLAQWIESLAASRSYVLDSIFSQVPDFNEVTNYESFIDEISEGFSESLDSIPVVPIIDKGQYRLELVSNIIYDTTGISSAGILTDAQILEFSNWQDYFPHPDLRKGENFTRFLEKYHSDYQEYNVDCLLNMFDNENFLNWLKVPDNNFRFIEFLLAHNLLEDVVTSNKTLFIGNDGELYDAEDIYEDVDRYLYDLECFADTLLPRLSESTRNHFDDNQEWKRQTEDIFKKFDAEDIVDDIMGDADYLELLQDAENSYRFIHFLALEDVDNDYLTNLPFVNSSGSTVDDFDRIVFFNSSRGLEVKSMPWMNTEWIEFLSEGYFTRDDEKCQSYLTKNLGVLEYEDKAIISNIVLREDYKADINEKLAVIESCVNFVSFASANSEWLADGSLKEFSLHFNKKGGEGVYGSAESDSFFYSPDYEKYDLLPWVPEGWLYSLDEKYLTGLSGNELELRKKFITRTFGVRELTKTIFLKEILLKNIKDICDSLDDSTLNVAFWRWVKDNCSANVSDFRGQKVLTINAESIDCVSLSDIKNIYVSDYYLPDNKGLQSVVSKYDSSAEFIREDYVEKDTAACKKEWREFWDSLGIKTNISGLVFSYIIPHLSSIEDTNIPGLLAEAQDEFKDNNISYQNLTSIKLLCNDDTFRSIGNCVLVNCPATVKEPFASLSIANQCSLYRHSSDIWRLLNEIAGNTLCKVISNLQEWREVKIDQYLKHQLNSEVDKSLHYDFIEEILNIDDDDRKDLKKLSEVLLYDRVDVLCKPSELTLGSVFNPYCDFEHFEVSLHYINDKYASLNCDNVTSQLRNVFPKLHARFEESDIKYLCDIKFSMFFWGSYLARKTANLDVVKKWIEAKSFKGYQCIPTSDGQVYKAEDLYSLQRLGNENNTDFDYTKQIANSASSFPCRDFKPEIYELFNMMGFRTSLRFEDAIYALQMTHSKTKRSDLLKWMSEQFEESNSLHREAIEAYRNSEKAVWKNGRGKTEHISRLYALDITKEHKKLEQYFKTSPLIIDKDYFSAIDSTFIKECSMLRLPVIKWADMDFVPETEPKSDNSKLHQQLRNYLLLVSAIECSEGWAERFNQLCEKFDKLSFVKCLSISLTNKLYPELSQKTRKFDCQGDTFYYVGEYDNRLVFIDFVATLREKLDSELDEDMFKLIFEPKDMDEFNEFVNEYCSDLAADENFRNTISQQLNLTLESVEEEEQIEEFNEEPQQTTFTLVDYPDVVEDNLTDVIPSEIGEIPECNDKDDVDIVTNVDDEPAAISMIHPNLGKPTKIEQKPTFDSPVKPTPASILDEYVCVEEADDIESAEDETDVSSNEEHFASIPDPDRRGYMGSVDKDNDYQPIGERPHSPRTRRHPKPYTREEVNRLRSTGTPLELESLEPTKEELDILAQCGISPEQIADTNYLAQLRLYNNLVHERHEEPEESMSDFIRNADDVTTHALKGGRYIHTCSAARGVMYISPSVWDKMVDDKWTVCVYLDGKGKNFHYINSAEEFLKLVSKDDVVIKITGKEKVDVVNKLYRGLLSGVKGTAYTLIRVAARTNMDAVFAHYVGAMAETNDGNEDMSDY